MNTGDTSTTRLRLTLGGQPWRVRTAVQADSSHLLTFLNPVNKENHLSATLEKGADVQYTFQLLDLHGRPRFTRHLHKADFAKVVYGTAHGGNGRAAHLPGLLAGPPSTGI